ncbi:MAG: methionine synthase [Bacteroidales bacterium]|nr:methionine synthase [Bacteroidales bacterium]
MTTIYAHPLHSLLSERILMLDGAMGTMIQQYDLTEEDFRKDDRLRQRAGQLKGNNDLLNLTRPDLIEEIQRKYLEAGTDILSTNTFSSQVISMADYGCEDLVPALNVSGAQIARRLADEYTQRNPDKPRFVAGAVGPTNRTASMSPDVNDPAYRAVTFHDLTQAYGQQIDALIEGGVDVILIETIFDTLNAKAALYACEEVMQRRGHRLPIMVSVTVSDLSGRTLSGQTLSAFITSISHAPLLSVGLNCSFGAREILPFLREMAEVAPFYISAYPNAGLPNGLGQYDQTPEEMAAQLQPFFAEGLLNLVGGCCGTTDAHIAQLPRLIANNRQPIRQPKARSPHLVLSGLEQVVLTPEVRFMNVGERCNVAGSRRFLRLINEKKYTEAVSIARQQVEDGALVVDINLDDGLLDTEAEMRHFVNLLSSEPEVARVPFMIDSSKWPVIRAALQCCQGKCIVNSISLKEGEKEFMSHAREIRRYGAAVVVMAFDEIGQADTYERRIEICERAYRLLVHEVGFPPEDIIFDPNVLAICTGMEEHRGYALDFIRATEWIRQNLPGAHISGGVSNLSFSFRGNDYLREAMHAVFLYHAIGKGMDMGIVNPATSVTYSDIPADLLAVIEDVIFNRRPEAEEELIERAEVLKAEQLARKNGAATQAATQKDEWRQGTVEARLSHALIKGIPDHLDEDIAEALPHYPNAVAVIEGPLMDAMNVVGELFGAGKMFLPQVVKTARTMKAAVAILQPIIEAERPTLSEGEEPTSEGDFVMATVKGDVHDIGKNIVGVVLGCNNYNIHDLGVMVPAERIVQEAIEKRVDYIGLSGLITPSLDEMVTTVRAVRDAGLRIPVLIGGATTSKLHTALKIAPEYPGPAIWVKDASQMVIVAAQLKNPTTRESYVAAVQQEYESLRQAHANKQKPQLATLETARSNKLQLFS